MQNKKRREKKILVRVPGPNSRRNLLIEDVVEPRFYSGSKSLEEAFPEIAEEWCYKKNCGFGPEDFARGSTVKAWWICSNCNFEWQASIANRTKNSSGCPYCNRGETTNLSKYPQALEEFDHRRNKGIDPHCLRRREQVWWKCSAGADHRWYSAFTKTEGIRCPFCLSRRPSSTNNAAKDKLLVKEFHPSRNGKIKLVELTLGSCLSVWWQCSYSKSHVFKNSVKNRHRNKQGCPICAQRLLRKKRLSKKHTDGAL